MLNLIPWKKREQTGNIAVKHAEPTRQSDDLPLTRLRHEFDSLWDRFISDPWMTRGSNLPSLWNAPHFNWGAGEWEETADSYVFRVELPGFEPDDLDVKVSGSILTLHAEREEREEQQGGHYRSYGSFHRTLSMPSGVKREEIEAKYHSGVLEVQLPKDAQSCGKRIPVHTN